MTLRERHRCWAEVDLNALRNNLSWIRHFAGPRLKIMTVVKADAYGHGLRQIAALLMQSGTDIFGVANLAEARAIRAVGKGWPILMLGACLPAEASVAVRDGVRLTISTREEAERFAGLGRESAGPIRVHVKIDTGMGRLGAPPKAALDLIQFVAQEPNLILDGLYTHLSSAETDGRYTAAQKRAFANVVAKSTANRIRVPLIHCANSSGFLYEKKSYGNLIRPGLLVYGVIPPGTRSPVIPIAEHLQPALSFKCKVSHVKSVPKGTSLSYCRSFVAPRSMRIATLTAGYGDGYMRMGSNRAEVIIRESRCRVVGRITMDQTLVDVSDLPDLSPGDEAVLIGRQGKATIKANELADWTDSIPWEVLTNITYRVPRIYLGGKAA